MVSIAYGEPAHAQENACVPGGSLSSAASATDTADVTADVASITAYREQTYPGVYGSEFPGLCATVEYTVSDILIERIRQIDPDDLEFWSACDLMLILEYTKWQNFKTVLLKAQVACEHSGSDPADHCTDASKMVAIGSDAKSEIEDMHLPRFACYFALDLMIRIDCRINQKRKMSAL